MYVISLLSYELISFSICVYHVIEVEYEVAQVPLESKNEIVVASTEVEKEAVDEADDSLAAAKRRFVLEDIFPLVRQVAGTRSAPLVVEAGHEPPPSMAGQSCVYVLHIMKVCSSALAVFLYSTLREIALTICTRIRIYFMWVKLMESTSGCSSTAPLTSSSL